MVSQFSTFKFQLSVEDVLAKAQAKERSLDRGEISFLLSLSDSDDIAKFFAAAYEVKVKHIGRRVALRGIIEAGNICSKDCLYCGIRRSNGALGRYSLSEDDIYRLAEECAKENYASLVIQSGELESDAHTLFIERVLKRIEPLNLGVTLSLGEQSEEVYKRWRDAGAARYLLRIETSNKELYAKLHPTGHSWERRVECLRALRRTGYQVGTGVMSCLPCQSIDDLAQDIIFFGEMDVDMIGMGPYIPHPEAPLSSLYSQDVSNEERLLMGLKMIAATRLYLHDINIAAATALQALADDGREQGIMAGANVIMPNITDTQYRRNYQLYAGKPCLDENEEDYRSALEKRLTDLGETIVYGERGDSLHYARRVR